MLEVVGLPDMDVVEKAAQEPAMPPGWVPAAAGRARGRGDDETAAAGGAASRREGRRG